MGKTTGRAKFFEKFDEHIEKDHDPEAEHVVASDSDEESGNENAGTEHYVNVGKSKLRERGENSLGPQYRGSKVSRSALEQDSSDEEDEEDEDDEEYDDPETANLEADTADAGDSEISSDDALGESDNDKLSKFVFRGSSNPKKPRSKRATAADYMSNSEEEEDELDDDEDEDDEEEDMDDGLEALIDGEAEESGDEEDEDEDEEDEDDDEDEDEDEDEEDGEEEESSKAKPATNGRTPNADIEKGAAIQKQRKLYDGLLNLRIRLQKAIVAANTFSALEEEQEEEDDPTAESYDTAEATAVSLLNSIRSLRENCGAPVTAGTKRKRDYEVSATSTEIWEQLQEEDRRALKFRERCLEKWSRKVQSVNVTAPKGLSSQNKTLVDSLHDQLNNPENRLTKRTRVPRSCAPAQHAKKMVEDATIFDDADFYQLLLKELVEQRTVDSSSSKQTSAVPSVVLTASRENRTRKVVDRKASKGRKMRFTVHEKLQNFMAPEDRRQWEQSAIDRFFGTMFGRKMELNEDEDEAMDDVADADFKLFA